MVTIILVLYNDWTIIIIVFITAQRLQLASVYKGEAEKILQVKRAEAEAEAKYLGGVGVARQRQAITDGLRENILNFSHKVEGASAKEVMDLIMITQYFDTIKDLGNSSNNTTVFLPHGPGHVRDISDQIRNGLMEASAGQVDGWVIFTRYCQYSCSSFYSIWLLKLHWIYRDADNIGWYSYFVV